jgi:hypothetical protein
MKRQVRRKGCPRFRLESEGEEFVDCIVTRRRYTYALPVCEERRAARRSVHDFVEGARLGNMERMAKAVDGVDRDGRIWAGWPAVCRGRAARHRARRDSGMVPRLLLCPLW